MGHLIRPDGDGTSGRVLVVGSRARQIQVSRVYAADIRCRRRLHSRYWLTLARLVHPLRDWKKHKLFRSRVASKEWDATDDTVH